MKRMIRLMTYVVVAAAAPAAFAGGSDRAASHPKQAMATTRCECVDPPADEAGGGRGELPATTAAVRGDDAEARAAAMRRAQDAAAIQEQERRTLEEIWTRP